MPLPSFLSEEIQGCLGAAGFDSLFPVQEKIYSHILASYEAKVRYDVCVCSPTGSGKTLAYAVPIVESLRGRVVPRLRCIVVTPRKELAQQVFSTMKLFKKTGLVTQLASGEDLLRVDKARYVSHQPDVLVVTPSRLIELISNISGFDLKYLRYLVLDECDMLLADTTQDWLRTVLHTFEDNRARCGAAESASSAPLHRLLFSATLTHNLAKLNQAKLANPRHFMLSSDGSTLTNVQRYAIPDTLTEIIGVCPAGEKILALRKLLTEEKGTVLVFTKTTDSAHNLARMLQLLGASAEEFSGQLTGAERSSVVHNLRLGVSTCGICSDALARGLDVDRVSLVVNYEVPPFIQTYIHRVGRTARAGRSGTAVTLVESEEEQEEFLALRKRAEQNSRVGALPTVSYNVSGAKNAGELRAMVADSVTVLRTVLEQEKKGLLSQRIPLSEVEGVAGIKELRTTHQTLLMQKKKELHKVLTEASRKRKRGADGEADGDEQPDRAGSQKRVEEEEEEGEGDESE